MADGVNTPPFHNAAVDAEEIARLNKFAHMLDSRYRVPGTNIRFGWDAIVSVVPGLGDALAAGPSAYLIYRAYRLGLPKHALAQMAGNVGIDFFFGSVPVLGSVFDVFWKANNRNMRVMRRHLKRRSGLDDSVDDRMVGDDGLIDVTPKDRR